jgi:hypothetical protein
MFRAKILTTTHSPFFQHFQAIQYFSQVHPEFDYFWQLELDSRYSGHYYEFLEKTSSWSRTQPRKYLWERNSRFYIPSFHGSYSNFTDYVSNATGHDGIWGPPITPGVTSLGPNPPFPDPQEDEYSWGVGEEADLITLLPIFDPSDSSWVMANILYGFPRNETQPDDWHHIPRRASVNTMSRSSGRLLRIMHYLQARPPGLGFASEMTATSFAFQHGLKAVYVPHPIFTEREYTGEWAQEVFNAGDPGDRPSGGKDGVFSLGEERYLEGMSYYWATSWPGRIWRLWQGWNVAGMQDQKAVSIF